MIDHEDKKAFLAKKALLEGGAKRVVITAGMPYSNGPIHLGHLAGAFVPADIYARWWRMVVGAENVVFVSGSDDHGVTSFLRCQKEGESLRDYIAGIRSDHQTTFKMYDISLDKYGSTSNPTHLKEHTKLCQRFVQGLHNQKLISTRLTKQWFDQDLQLFLPDRLVEGTCPRCGASGAHSQECDRCGAQYSPTELINPVSTLSGKSPVLKETQHLWFDMFPLASTLHQYLGQKGRKFLQKPVLSEIMGDIAPALSFHRHSSDGSGNPANDNHDIYQKLAASLGKHKKRFGSQDITLQFASYESLEEALSHLQTAGIEATKQNSWAQRAISRDISWGVKLPKGVGLTDSQLAQKTLYVWPESLIAPLSFTDQVLKLRASSATYKDYWHSADAERHQFIGIDNIYFYGVMQSAMWLAQRRNPLNHKAQEGELQLSNIHTYFHLQVDGEKMSKSRGNFYSAAEMIHSYPYSSDQIRYFMAFLSLREKPCNFDFAFLAKRNDFLSGPLNAAFEKPLSAARKKFGGKVPEGRLLPKVVKETEKVLHSFVRWMPQARYPQFLLSVENYARLVNSLFATHKPHDDRYPLKEREDALYSCFFILKNLVIFLHPFAPKAMEELRKSLNLSKDVYALSKLATGISGGHTIEDTPRQYFPKTVPES